MPETSAIEQVTLDKLLADLTTSFALNAVIEAWSGRDGLDAEHDARLLHAALARSIDHRLGVAP